MHDQVIGARAMRCRMRDQLPDRMPLMEPGKDQRLDVRVTAPRRRSTAPLGVLVLHVQEPVDQVQPGVPLPDLLPQV